LVFFLGSDLTYKTVRIRKKIFFANVLPLEMVFFIFSEKVISNQKVKLLVQMDRKHMWTQKKLVIFVNFNEQCSGVDQNDPDLYLIRIRIRDAN
jgi:hypothetical protein